MGWGCASYPDSVILGKARRAADPEGREVEADQRYRRIDLSSSLRAPE